MNLLKKLFLSLILLFSISGSLNAAEEGQTRFGIELGWAPVNLEAEKTAQQLANLSGSTVGVTYDTGSFVGRIFGDYGVSSNLSLEFGLFQSSSADATYTIGASSATESYDASGIDFSVVFNDTDGWFGKFGMHSSTVEGVGTIVIGGTSYSVTASQDGTGPLLGFGFEEDDYRYSVTHYVDVGDTTDYTMFSVGWLF
jgi:hypothetical protein